MTAGGFLLFVLRHAHCMARTWGLQGPGDAIPERAQAPCPGGVPAFLKGATARDSGGGAVLTSTPHAQRRWARASGGQVLAQSVGV